MIIIHRLPKLIKSTIDHYILHACKKNIGKLYQTFLVIIIAISCWINTPLNDNINKSKLNFRYMVIIITSEYYIQISL